MKQCLLIETHFFPCLDYFISALECDALMIDKSERYQKQTYRNRTYLLGANNVISFTIPILHGIEKPVLTNQVLIDNGQSWKKLFLKSIKSGYGKAPYFEHYYPFIEKLFLKHHTYLLDLNLEVLTVCLELLQIHKPVIIKDNIFEWQNVDNKDLRNCINPKKNPYNKDILARLSYIQTFGKEFVNNLCVLDLLFCEGNHSSTLLIEALKQAKSV